MKPPQANPRRGDVIAIALVAGMLIFLLLAIVIISNLERSDRRFNFGFGSDWQCNATGWLEPVCRRKTAVFPRR
jgi:uncharacterized integral membrane protein